MLNKNHCCRMASESACRLSPVLSHPAGAGLKASCVPFPPGENLCSLHLDCCVLSRFSCVWLFVTPWTAARQVCLSVGFSRQESWSGLPCPLPEDLPNPGIEPISLSYDSFTSRHILYSQHTWEALLAPRIPHVPLFPPLLILFCVLSL